MSRVATLERFPFPLLHNQQVGPNVDPDTFPIAMSLEDAMKLYWRIRTLEVTWTLSGTYTIPSESATLSVANLAFQQTVPIYYLTPDTPVAASDETQLVTGCSFTNPNTSGNFTGTQTGGTISCNPSPTSTQATESLIFELFGVNANRYNSSAMAYDGTSYYPSLFLSGSIKALANYIPYTSKGNPNIQNQIQLFLTLGNVQNNTLITTVNLMGYSLNVPSFYSTGDGGSATDVTSVIDIKPTLWWPYADADGNPLYDTTTGAMIG